jgi:sugar diacid utilization regulator
MLGELRQMGVALEPPFVLNLLAIPAEYLLLDTTGKEQMERQHHIDQLIDFIQDSDVGVSWQTPYGIAVLQSFPDPRSRVVSVDNAKLAARELIQSASRNWLGLELAVGVSHSTDEVREVAQLFEQARAALQYGPVVAPGQEVYHWHDLGCYQFIVMDLQSAQVRQFIQEHLGPIINKKQGGNAAEGLATLKAIVSGDSLQVIADRLYVHKQTIVFRKRKLEDALGVDLDVLENRMNLAIAMKLLSLLP